MHATWNVSCEFLKRYLMTLLDFCLHISNMLVERLLHGLFFNYYVELKYIFFICFAEKVSVFLEMQNAAHFSLQTAEKLRSTI